MKYPCDMVKDLLPLYHDEVCSDSSKKIVEEHLAECDSCKSTMRKMKDNTYDKRLQEEREHVVEHFNQKIKRKSLLAGSGLASVLTVPILVCLIVNIATGHALDWFFIVLTALMVFASLTVVPLIVEEKKGLWTLGSFSGSLQLLLLTCCLYSGGNWFWVASISVLFGLSVVFIPYVIRQLPLQGFASRNKGLIVMAADTVLLYALIIVCGFYNNPVNYWRTALLNTTLCLILPWTLFVIIRYFKANGFIRAGICVIIGSLFVSLIHDMIYRIMEGTWHISFAHANLRIWNYTTIDANIYLLVLLSGCVIGGILLIAGMIRSRIKKQ